jgi:hypothetical protein
VNNIFVLPCSSRATTRWSSPAQRSQRKWVVTQWSKLTRSLRLSNGNFFLSILGYDIHFNQQFVCWKDLTLSRKIFRGLWNNST